jgi:HAD superfamily hydrolase (TIGR01509 family)
MEWATYLHDELQVERSAVEIAGDVVEEMAARYDDGPPLLAGAVETVDRLARRWPLGLASSSPTRLIDVVLQAAGLTDRFRVTMSTEEVGVGKPAPDIYLEVARRLEVDPGRAAAVEDSTNGLRAALAAGLRVIAVPTKSFPPAPDVLARAAAVVASLAEITDAVVDPPARATTPRSS